MKTIIVTKTGMVLNTPLIIKQSSSGGEIGETLGLLKHLVSLGYQVIYFGKVKGELPTDVIHIIPEFIGKDGWESKQELMMMSKKNVEQLKQYKPDLFIDMVGMHSRLYPAIGSNLLIMTVRYLSTILGAIGELDIPTICIETDVRGYPKNDEMNNIYPLLKPCALFSQRNIEFSRIIYGVRYRIKEIRCDAHSWWRNAGWDRPEYIYFKNREWNGTLLMHAHIQTGYKIKERHFAFHNVLGDIAELKELENRKFRVIGNGWEHFILSNGMPAINMFPNMFQPAVPVCEIFNELANSKCCPMITPIKRNWPISAKASMAAWSGCMPIFYGRDEIDFAYDPHEEYLSLGSKYRIEKPGDLIRVLDSHLNELEITRERGRLSNLFTPKFEPVTSCIDAILNGVDTSSENWWNLYGGYRL